MSSLWEDSTVETYVDQPPQQMSDSRLQHATSAAAVIPTSAAFSWVHNKHSSETFQVGICGCFLLFLMRRARFSHMQMFASDAQS